MLCGCARRNVNYSSETGDAYRGICFPLGSRLRVPRGILASRRPRANQLQTLLRHGIIVIILSGIRVLFLKYGNLLISRYRHIRYIVSQDFIEILSPLSVRFSKKECNKNP